MSWVTPAEFVANETLTAAKLNQLVDAVAFLNGLSAGPLPPFHMQIADTTPGLEWSYSIRHRSRYLHVVYWSDGADFFEIAVNGVMRHENYTPPNGYNDYVLDMNSYGLTVGAFLTVRVKMEALTGYFMHLLYVTELAHNTSLV